MNQAKATAKVTAFADGVPAATPQIRKLRKIIAAMIISLDGYIEDSEGQTDWISSWEDVFDLEQQIGTCILGAKMYPDYEKYWSAVHATPRHPFPSAASQRPKARLITRTLRCVRHTSCCLRTWARPPGNTRALSAP